MSDINHSSSALALAAHYREPIKVTVAFVSLYFLFLGIQTGSKFYLYFTQGQGKDKGDGQPKQKESLVKIKYQSTDKVA
jgi:hypothetical protein